MKKKGFTLIEMLAVVVILGIIIGLGVTAYSKYLMKSRDKSYSIAEKSMMSSAQDAIADCLTGEGKNREICKNHELLEKQYEYELVYLKELVGDDYMDAIRDPYNTDKLCSEDSYVYITNKENTDEVNNAEFDYRVCLICSKYKSKDCLDDIENQDRDYNAYCKVTYEDGTIYNGEWTNKNLKLELTASEGYRYGISYYTYSYGSTSKNAKANKNSIATPILNTTVNQQKIKVVATDGLNGKSNDGYCQEIKLDKDKFLSARITGMLETKKTVITSNSWASENVLLTVITNPSEIISGATYEWYYEGSKIDGATNSTYLATKDGKYSAKVTKTLTNETIKTDDFIVKIDRTEPTIQAILNPINLNSEPYFFTNNVIATYGISDGETTCKPPKSKKRGTYDVTCTANGNNGLTASVTFTARHSYPATPTCPNNGTYNATTKKCDYTNNEKVCGCQTYKTCQNQSCGCENLQEKCCDGDCSSYAPDGTTNCEGMCGYPGYDPNHCCTHSGNGTLYTCNICLKYKSCAIEACGCKTGKSCSKTPVYTCPKEESTLGDGSTYKPDKATCYY